MQDVKQVVRGVPELLEVGLVGPLRLPVRLPGRQWVRVHPSQDQVFHDRQDPVVEGGRVGCESGAGGWLVGLDREFQYV